MDVKQTLISWIGHTDLRAMARDLPAAQRQRFVKNLGGVAPPTGHGPVKALLEREPFDHVHLISNYGPRPTNLYAKWLGHKADCHLVKLDDPTDHANVFSIADKVLAAVTAGPPGKDAQLCMHLSPGTPAMAAIWILLGKSRYPATFWQTHQGRAWITDIPFDLMVDFIPEVLRLPDAHFQHLASSSPSQTPGFEAIIGDSRPIRLATGRARRAAIRHVPVLLLGESGTGKELFARAMHDASPRRAGPIVAINCAAIPSALLESELFGHKKGAYTGADEDRPGAFEQADGGTLFLDEVAECDHAMQAKLLRVLQPPAGEGPCHRVFRRLGESRDRTSDVRIIAATNRDLLNEVNRNAFREDLYYRLAVITIKLPPLRHRKSDVPAITKALLAQINEQFRTGEPGYQEKSICPSTMRFVKSRDWPGNVRQLYNVLLQAAVMAESDVLQPPDVEAALAETPGTGKIDAMDHPLGDGFDLTAHLERIRKHYLQRAMAEARGAKSQAARLLGLKSYQTLDAQLKRLRI